MMSVFCIVKIPDAVMETENRTNKEVIYMRLFCLLAISVSVIVSGTFIVSGTSWAGNLPYKKHPSSD